uniref:Uncharacterized protein n=1 Tax=Physcomitrium patens TaxID=3218 RepID=A0A2K1JL58_PHYPA|nr:hypothetical protein PHYPA_017078 [Physcomitrium patens]
MTKCEAPKLGGISFLSSKLRIGAHSRSRFSRPRLSPWPHLVMNWPYEVKNRRPTRKTSAWLTRHASSNNSLNNSADGHTSCGMIEAVLAKRKMTTITIAPMSLWTDSCGLIRRRPPPAPARSHTQLRIGTVSGPPVDPEPDAGGWICSGPRPP